MTVNQCDTSKQKLADWQHMSQNTMQGLN